MTYNLGPVRPVCTKAADLLGPMFGIAEILGYRNDPAAEDHALGLALDFMVYTDAAKGQALADYVVAHASEVGLHYAIWQQRIYNVTRAAEGWRLMPDRGGITANHFDHVHVSFYDGVAGATATGAATGTSPTAGTYTGPITPYAYSGPSSSLGFDTGSPNDIVWLEFHG